MKRVSLTIEDFRDLVEGRVVEKEDVEIALEDIGFTTMDKVLQDAKKKSGN